jgi:hypothetical protein
MIMPEILQVSTGVHRSVSAVEISTSGLTRGPLAACMEYRPAKEGE